MTDSALSTRGSQSSCPNIQRISMFSESDFFDRVCLKHEIIKRELKIPIVFQEFIFTNPSQGIRIGADLHMCLHHQMQMDKELKRAVGLPPRSPNIKNSQFIINFCFNLLTMWWNYIKPASALRCFILCLYRMSV